ncbi:MAG: asparagine synthase C-terminal domain-containing protein, partial [Bacteroidia bacterium]|nr:asparagine synthase C-terminal domain-containing protein [Bacteroidia bacterium]
APYHHKSIGEYIRSKHCHISTSKLNEIFPQTSFSEDCRKLYTFNLPFTKRNLLEWMRYCEFQGHLQRVLTKVDRMSMANSLEVRIPFLDGEIMNLIKTHVPEEFDENEHLKFILKELMSEYYPKSIVQNKKKGFSVPINDWLRNELKPDLTNLVLNSPIYGEEYMNVNAIKNHVKAFIHGEHHSGWGVWIIYAWQKWAFKNNFLVYEDFS